MTRWRLTDRGKPQLLTLPWQATAVSKHVGFFTIPRQASADKKCSLLYGANVSDVLVCDFANVCDVANFTCNLLKF